MDRVKLALGNGLVPRYVSIVNTAAEGAGLTVTTGTEERKDGTYIVAIWRGTSEQFRATGLLQPSYRLPLKEGAWDGGCIDGRVKVCNGIIEARAEFGWQPDRLEYQSDIEVGHYSDGIEYHGSTEALTVAGICTSKQLPRQKRARRSLNSDGNEREWLTCRYPDGSIAHFIESAESQQKRRAEFQARMEEYNQLGERKREPIDYASPAEWLEEKEDVVCLAVRATFSKDFASVETKSGLRFTANTARLEEIANAIEALAQQIRAVPVRVECLERESTPEAREQTAMVSTDGLFQRFMQRAQGDPPAAPS